MAMRALVIEPGYADHRTEQGLLAEIGATVEVLRWGGDRARLLDGIREADLLFVRDVALDAAALSVCKNCKGIVRYGVGIDRVDLDEARRRRIAVANIPDYGADIEVADQTLALFLAVQRRVVTRDRAVRAGAWGIAQREPIDRIAGKTLGLIGFGRIGRAVAGRFAGFGVTDLLVHDPFVGEVAARQAGARKIGIDELAAGSDIVSIHAPPADSSRPLVGEAFIGRMRRGAILLNTARGQHVDEHALAAAIRSGKLFGAGLDVFRSEPPEPGNPLLVLDTVVVSDHTGWYSERTVAELQRIAGEEAARILSGKPPVNWVNPW